MGNSPFYVSLATLVYRSVVVHFFCHANLNKYRPSQIWIGSQHAQVKRWYSQILKRLEKKRWLSPLQCVKNLHTKNRYTCIHIFKCQYIYIYIYLYYVHVAFHLLPKFHKTSFTSHLAAKEPKLSAKVATTSLGLRCQAHAGRKPPQATVQLGVGGWTNPEKYAFLSSKLGLKIKNIGNHYPAKDLSKDLFLSIPLLSPPILGETCLKKIAGD